MKALVALLKADPAQIESLSIEQVVALCGNGKLADHSPCSQELRQYLQIAKSGSLFSYLQSCLLKAFEKGGGFVLQEHRQRVWEAASITQWKAACIKGRATRLGLMVCGQIAPVTQSLLRLRPLTHTELTSTLSLATARH